MNTYFIIYKPYQVLTQFSSLEGKQTLADFFNVPKDVYPVGRLDFDSEGLLILTNDRTLNNRLLHPSAKHEREYWVQVDGRIQEASINELKKGVTINVEGKKYLTNPCDAFLFNKEPSLPERIPPIRFRKEIPAPWISITLTEGKNRQVRKMTAAVGYPTLRLVRYRIGSLNIKGMLPGEMQQMDRDSLFDMLF